ncbi:reverse transcriptase domain-containing protein [Tanacetum coccineum]
MTSALNVCKDMEHNLEHDLHSDSSTMCAFYRKLNVVGGDIDMISNKASLNSVNASPLNDSNVPQHAGPCNDSNIIKGDIGKQTDERDYLAAFPTLVSTNATNALARNSICPVSYAKIINGNSTCRVMCKVNFRSLNSDKPINAKAKVKIHKASILDVHSRFSFSLYGYFMSKRVAFPVVENYVKKAWKKFGLVHVMMNSKGFFFFKFASVEGMNEVLENDGLIMMTTKLGKPIMLDSYTSSMCLQSWGRIYYAQALNDIRVHRVLKEDIVIAIPNVEDDGKVLHTVRVEYEWEPPRYGVCMVFGHDDMLCAKRHVEKPKKQYTNHDGFQYNSSYHSTNVGSKVLFKPKKPIWQAVSKKNSDSSSGDELGLNGGSSNIGKKVVQDMVGLTCDSPSNTLLVTRINDLESQMIEGTLMLMDNDGKPLKPSKSTLCSSSNVVSKKVDNLDNEDNDSEVEEKENHGKDPYDDDDFDDPGLTDDQMKFANAFDINLGGKHK